MPRDRPDTQPAQAANSQAYGAAGEQLAAQAAMPLPQAPNGVPGGPSQPPPDVSQLAAGFDPGITPLTAPTARPGEPVTHGLPLGAGGGPEVLTQPGLREHTAELLESMAHSSNDSTLADLAMRIRLRGR